MAYFLIPATKPGYSDCLLIICMSLIVSTSTYAGPRNVAAIDLPVAWTLKLAPSFTYGNYKDSPTLDHVTSVGVDADIQYLERGGLTIAASTTTLTMKSSVPNFLQNNTFISGRLNLTPDALPGLFTLRADVHRATNNDATNETNDVSVIAPLLSFINFNKNYYFDLGYTLSRYGDSNNINLTDTTLLVRQWTPTVGIGFNHGADWLQLRLYDIQVSNPSRAQGFSRTDALEAKWTHYLWPGSWMPEQVQLSAMAGSRIYAVDSDTKVLYNIADLQRSGVLAGVQWRFSAHVKLLLNAGYDRYETQSTGIVTSYSGSYFYTGLRVQM